MYKLLFLGAGFGIGYAVHKYEPIYESYFRTTIQENHSFQHLVNEKELVQPKIIDMLHSSPQKHFLHNLIVQHDEALNLLKVYYSKRVEQILINDAIQDDSKIELHVVFNASDHVQGHTEVVHGGMQATLIDNAMGQLSLLASGINPCATAYLNINYRKPVKCNQDYLINCEVTKIEGRKVFLKATIVDKDNTVCTEAEALFIQVKWATSVWKTMIQQIYKNKPQ